jgi:glycine cleavage system H protein
MEVFGTIEAVKAVSDLFSPISGEVIAINETLEEDPALVNSDPYGEGWMIRLRLTDPSEMDDLLTPEAYRSLIEDQ